MTNLGREESHCVFVETNIDTRLALLLHKSDTVSLFKDNFCKEHKQSFPEIGEIRVSAVKVKRGNYFYRFPDSMIVSKVFKGITENRFIDVEVEKVGSDVLNLKVVTENELSEIGKEIANCSNLALEGSCKSKKRKTNGCDRMIDCENGEKTAGLVKIGQEKDVASTATAELGDGHVNSRDGVNDRDEVTLVASDKHIKVVENCDGDLASKVEDFATERNTVQDVEKTKKQKEDKKGDVDQYASGAEAVDIVEVKKKKSKKKKQSCEDHTTDNVDEEKNDLYVPRIEEEPEFDGGKLETCVSSSVLKHNNVAPEVSSLETRVLPRCSCEGERARKLVIFDLNGMFADIVQDYRGQYVPDGRIYNRAVFRRPFVASFLDFCFEIFDIAIWSSRRVGLDYMTNTVMGKQARNLLFSFDQRSCTTTKFNTLENPSKPLFLKDLRRVWNRFGSCFTCGKQKYDETNTLLVDDSPHKALCNPPYTGIFPHPYQHTDREDSALGPNGELRKYMERLADAGNIQKFVEENPFGQTAINERHESWEFYSKVFEAYK